MYYELCSVCRSLLSYFARFCVKVESFFVNLESSRVQRRSSFRFISRFACSAKLNGCNFRYYLLCMQNTRRRSSFISRYVTKFLPILLARIDNCNDILLLFTTNWNGFSETDPIQGSSQPIILTNIFASPLKPCLSYLGKQGFET